MDVIGLHVDLQNGWVRNTAKRTWRLYQSLRRVVFQRYISGYALRVVVGHLCHFFMVRRPALAVLSTVWRFIEEARDEVRWLDDEVVKELDVARGLLGVLRHNIGSEIAPFAYATDASTAGYAVLTTKLSQDEAWALLRHEERWRFHPRLVESDGPWTSAAAAETGLGALPAGDFSVWVDQIATEDKEGPVDDPQGDDQRPRDGRRVGAPVRRFDELADAVPAVPAAVSVAERWGRVICGGRVRAEAIHNKECRASLLALRRASARADFGDTVLIGLGDNLSEILSSSRGRARNWELNSLCRVAAAYQIASGMTWRRRHLVSAANPADFDSPLADKGVVLPGEALGRVRFGDDWRRLDVPMRPACRVRFGTHRPRPSLGARPR